MKGHLHVIALARYNIAFNSAMKCTPFEAMYGLRAKTTTEAEASLRLHITAEEGTGLTGLQSLTIINGINNSQKHFANLQNS